MIVTLTTSRSGPAQGSADSWEGPYTPIPIHQNSGPSQHCCEIAHAILIGKPGPTQGKVLLIQSNGSRWLWDPASPNSVSMDASDGEEVDNLFCCGHSADGDGDIVTHSGNRTIRTTAPTFCTPTQPLWSWVYDPSTMMWLQVTDLVHPLAGQAGNVNGNIGFWYPGSVRLPNGAVLSAGGGTEPLKTGPPCNDNPALPIVFANGWQIFDKAQGKWGGLGANQWYAGLPTTTGANGYAYEFNYYPLLFLIPTSPPYPATTPGWVFAAVATDNRGGAPAIKRSGSALMDLGVANWPAAGTWNILPSQITNPVTGNPRNLYYPTGILKPLLLDNQGQLATGQKVEVILLGGTDRNVPIATSPAHPDGGRPALSEVSWIDRPESATSTWSSTVMPPMNFERIYCTGTMLPTGELFVVGGSLFDFFPFNGQLPLPPNQERIAAPVLFPEMIDLLAPAGAPWVVYPPHISPRLYHSVPLLLRDGRVLVAGGYQGIKNVNAQGQQIPAVAPEHFTYENFTHSDIEIFSPDYLFAGARPEIMGIVGGGTTITYRTTQSPTFAINVARPGSAAPAQEIGSVCLISPGSVTHHNGWDQRYVGLSFTVSAGSPNTTLVITPPADGFVAPPGWYFLFINTNPAVTTVKIPSIAMFVKLQ